MAEPVQTEDVFANVSLADLAGLDLDTVEAKDRFQRFPECAARWRIKEAKLDVIDIQDNQVKCIRFISTAIEFYGSSNPEVKAEMVIGQEYEDMYMLRKTDDISYVKKHILNMGWEKSGNLSTVLMEMVQAGLEYNAIIKHTQAKNGKTYANMNDVTPAKPAEAPVNLFNS